jgi:hypothetical protein
MTRSLSRRIAYVIGALGCTHNPACGAAVTLGRSDALDRAPPAVLTLPCYLTQLRMYSQTSYLSNLAGTLSRSGMPAGASA